MNENTDIEIQFSQWLWTASVNREINRNNLITPLHEHDHDVEDYKSDVFTLKTKCKTIATKNQTNLRQVFDDATRNDPCAWKLPLLSVNQQCIVLDESRSLKFPYQHLNSVKWYLQQPLENSINVRWLVVVRLGLFLFWEYDVFVGWCYSYPIWWYILRYQSNLVSYGQIF